MPGGGALGVYIFARNIPVGIFAGLHFNLNS